MKRLQAWRITSSVGGVTTWPTGVSPIVAVPHFLKHGPRLAWPTARIPSLIAVDGDCFHTQSYSRCSRRTVRRLDEAMNNSLQGNAACIQWQNCSSHIGSGSDELVGWVNESPGRGTITLLWNCLLTIFLCTWVVIHPRIDKRKRFRICHKLALSVKTLVAPEFIAVEGAQEWTQARKIMKSCGETGKGNITLGQAFYIGMLGLRYRTSRGTKIIWPNQFVWLMQHGVIDVGDASKWNMSQELLQDRGNADGTAKLFALVQVGWFLIQCLVRAIKDLPLAPFESMTLGYIPLFALTYFFWWVKPKDIEMPSELELPPMTYAQRTEFESIAISDDFDDEDTKRQRSMWNVWYLTPRVFEKEARDKKLVQIHERAEQHIQHLTSVGLPTLRRAKPLPLHGANDTVLGHWDPDLYHSKLWPVTCLFGASFPALHLVSWNGTFPTILELWLWRAGSIVSVATMLIFMQFETVVVRKSNPLTFLKAVPPALYLVSRMILLGEAVAALRASNPAVYETFVLSNYWLHLG